MIIKLAYRNLFRNFRRTALTLSAIAFGIMMLIIFDSLLSGVDTDSYKKIIDLETGHVRIFARGYRDDMDEYPLDRSIKEPQAVIAVLAKDPDIEGVAPRVSFRIMLSDGMGELPAVGYGVDPAKDPSVFTLKNSIDGSFLAGSEEAMLLGDGLMDDFGLKEGDYLTLLTRTKYDTYQALDLKIKGVIRTENPKFDWSSAVIPLGLAQRALDMGAEVTEIDIRLRDPGKLEEVRARLEKQFPHLEISTWLDYIEDVKAIGAAKRQGRLFLFSSLFLIALIGIANTILLSAFERIKEIGMMAALGMKRRQIMALFVTEGAMIGFLGSFIGAMLASAAILLYLAPVGVDFSGLNFKELGDFGYRMTNKMYGEWDPPMVALTFFMGIIISAVTSIYPAWVASRMQPTEALRKN